VTAQCHATDKLTFISALAVIHAWAKSGGREAAVKAQHLLNNMRRMRKEGHSMAQPDTITVRILEFFRRVLRDHFRFTKTKR
jgi:hypothetical protein